jgi:hypothetical protein
MEKGICLLGQIPFPEKMLGFDTIYYFMRIILFVAVKFDVFNE